ncbi:MAG: glycine/sarcosine/betaine reductase selenoprotein B family protein [Myxococcota bacterium]
MPDESALAAWRPKFVEWVEKAKPFMAEGKAKKAFAFYPWFRGEGDPFVRLTKPARQTRFGLVTTGGYSIEGEQEPFSPFPSFDDSKPRIHSIRIDVDRSKLRIDHAGYDHRFAKEDINCNLPVDRLKEMEQGGEIGSIAPETHVVMGLQPNVAPLIETLIPELVARFKSDSVEAALLVPS